MTTTTDNTRADLEELTKQDFQNAAAQAQDAAARATEGVASSLKTMTGAGDDDVRAKGNATVREGQNKAADMTETFKSTTTEAAGTVRDQTAGALKYLEEQLKPNELAEQGEAQQDPEVKEFRQAAAQVAHDTKTAVQDNKPTSADDATQNPNEKSYLQQAGEAISAGLNRVNPFASAQAMEKDTTDYKAKARSEFDQSKESAREAAHKAGDSAVYAKDAAVDEARHLASRLSATADRAGDRAAEGADKAFDKAEDARRSAADYSRRAPSADEVKREGQEAKEQAKSGLQSAVDTTVDTAKYIAGRFTAPVSGDEQTDKKQLEKAEDKAERLAGKTGEAADNAQHKGWNILDRAKEAVAPHANKAEDEAVRAKKHGESLVGKARHEVEDTVDAAKRKAQELQDSITPKTEAEELLSEGYIPTNTAALHAQDRPGSAV